MEEGRKKKEQNIASHNSNAPDLGHKEDTPILAPNKERKQNLRKLVLSKLRNPLIKETTSFHSMPPTTEKNTPIVDSIMAAAATLIPKGHVNDEDHPVHFVPNPLHTPPQCTQIGQRKIGTET